MHFSQLATYMERLEKTASRNDMTKILAEVLKEAREEIKEERKIAESLFVENLLLETDFPEQKIASLAAVSIAFVKQVRKRLESEGKLSPAKPEKAKVNGRKTSK